MMQTLVNMLAGFIAFLATAVLSHFGVDSRAELPQREVHRTSDCRDAAPSKIAPSSDNRTC